MYDIKTGKWLTGISCIDEDNAIQILNNEAMEMYETLYSFNTENQGCQFNSDRFIQIKPQLHSIVQSIISRLSVINDGSFIVIDNATQTLI